MINLLNKIKLINNDNKNETFISYNNLSLKAIASCPDTINKEFDDTIYISLDSLINDIYNAYEALNNNSFRINLEAELNLKDLANIDKDVLLNGYIDFILNDNNQYNIKADLDIYALDIKTDISVIIIDNKIYLEVAGVNIMVLESDLDSLITDIKVALGLDNADNNTSLITKTQVFDILESLTLLSENKFSIDLTAVYEKLGVLTIALIESDDLLEAELNVNFLSASVDINTIDSYLVEEPTEYLDRNDIVNACEMVKSVLDISKEKEFNITLALNVYDDEILHLNAVGDILFKIYDNGRFDFGADLVLTEYDTDGISVKMVHYININLLSHEYFEALGTDSEDMLYITYGTNPDDLTSLIKMYTPANDILDLTATFTTLLGVDLSFLDGYSTFNFNDIDTSLLKDLFISDVEENTDKYSYKYDLSKFINSLNLDENKLTLDLDLSSALKSNNKNTVIVLDLNESDTNKAAVSLKDLYINNTKLSADLVLLKDSVTIEAPTIDSSWVDISTVDDLVAGLLTTASKKSFEIEGTITLSVLSLNAIDVPVIAKVLVYDDGSFELYIRLDYDKTTLVSLFGLIDNDYTEFYYKDGFIIEKASGDDLVEVKVSTETFFNNIIYYIFDLGMGMSDSIISQIEGSDSGDSSDDIIDAGVVLNSYTSDGTTFDISLNLGELISNSSIGNLDITFGSQEVVIKEDENGIETANALTTISKLSLDLYTAIDIALSDSLRLTNLETDSDGYTRLIAIDMTDIDNYINSYSYKTGYIYTNGSATSRISCNVTFVSDYKDNITESYTVESDITYPYSVLENNGVKYVVEGWYLDPEFTEKFTSTVMPGYNITLYAKLIEISGTYKLYIDGNYYMDFDTDTILNLTDNYSIYDDGIYYTYAGSDITSEFIFSKYFDLFDSDGTDLYFNLVTYQNERDGYYNIELNYSNSFTNKKYIAITLPNDLVFTYDYLNVGTYSVYDVNFWYDSNYDIYNDETAKLINYNTTLSAYYSVSNVLGYTIVDDKLYVSSYSYLGDDSINLIFPKYVLINDSYYTPYGISGTPFSGKTNISNVYLNDGLVIISSGAFGEATSIVDVYFGNTFSTLIANDGGRFDSFYMGDSSKMNSITFYLAEESTVDISAWYCYKSWLFGYSYHNYDSSRFSYYNGSINSYVNSIF